MMFPASNGRQAFEDGSFPSGAWVAAAGSAVVASGAVDAQDLWSGPASVRPSAGRQLPAGSAPPFASRSTAASADHPGRDRIGPVPDTGSAWVATCPVSPTAGPVGPM